MKLKEQVLTIEQVKHLQELGLDMSDAALCWAVGETAFQDMTIKHQSVVSTDSKPQRYPFIKEIIPTYTLQEVLDELPDVVYVEFNKGACILRHEYIDGMYSLYYDSEDGEMYGLVNDSSFLKAAYDMLCWVLENGYLKEET